MAAGEQENDEAAESAVWELPRWGEFYFLLGVTQGTARQQLAQRGQLPCIR